MILVKVFACMGIAAVLAAAAAVVLWRDYVSLAAWEAATMGGDSDE